MQRLASRAERRIPVHLRVPNILRLRLASSTANLRLLKSPDEAASGCTHCCLGVTHAMRPGHQRSRAENVPEANGSLKRKQNSFCDFRVEDGE